MSDGENKGGCTIGCGGLLVILFLVLWAAGVVTVGVPGPTLAECTRACSPAGVARVTSVECVCNPCLPPPGTP